MAQNARMDVIAPPATGVRHHWSGLPAPVREAVEDILGARVVQARSQSGGFSPGVAARVRLVDGRRAFVKAVSAEANPGSPDLHRAEARHTAALPPGVPAPRLLGSYDDGTHVALVLEDIDGRQPRVPWDAAELDRVLAAVGELGAVLTPAPIDAPAAADRKARMFSGWRALSAGGDTGRLDPWAARNLGLLAELESGWAEPASPATASPTVTCGPTTSCSPRTGWSSSTGRTRCGPPPGSTCWRCCRAWRRRAAPTPRPSSPPTRWAGTPTRRE